MGTGSNLSSLSSQIKTHRKHHEEPGNLTALIISFPPSSMWHTGHSALLWACRHLARGVGEEKREKQTGVCRGGEKAPAPDTRVHPPPRSLWASPGARRSPTTWELAPSGFLKKNTRRREVKEVEEGLRPPSQYQYQYQQSDEGAVKELPHPRPLAKPLGSRSASQQSVPRGSHPAWDPPPHPPTDGWMIPFSRQVRKGEVIVLLREL